MQPNFPEARINLAQLLENEGNLIAAWQQYRQALVEAPHDEEAQFRLFHALVRHGSVEDARAVAVSALQDHPQSARLHSEMGLLNAKTGDLTGARDQINMAIKLQPNVSEFHLELSRILRDLKLPQQKAELERALQLDPRSTSAHYALAELLKKEGDPEGAKAEYERVRQIKDDQAHFALAVGFLRAGVELAQAMDYTSAAVEFRKAVAANPKSGEAWFDLAGALLQSGRVEDAVKEFPRAIALAPQWPEAHYRYAEALLKSNRREEAKDELRIALEQDPSHEGARTALQELR